VSIFTGPLGLKARQLGRKLGLNSWFGRLLAAEGYEPRFAAAIARCLRKGDNVWDVGANTGSYSLAFSDQVGLSGCIFAFEPSPQNVAYLRQRTVAAGNIVVLPFGLSNSSGQIPFKEEPDGTTSHIASEHRPCRDEEVITIEIRTGDDAVSSGEAAFPNVIKIDVEGHELQVILGLPMVLEDPRLRCVFVEVHFGILQKCGMQAAPRQIERTLMAKGFRISWTDPSHMQAIRW
jgi:FkbM family methyltransferase